MITLYSQYFNPAISRKYGRRISRERAKNYSDDKGIAGVRSLYNPLLALFLSLAIGFVLIYGGNNYCGIPFICKYLF